MNYEAVIGIEIHCELMTKTKMFSSAPLDYGATPNTAVNEIDLAMPGTLPSVNKQAVAYGLRLAQALHLEIDSLVRFDRKNYFYSDLPKGYQITQQFHPLGQHGYFDILVKDEVKRIRINRLHMEEDTAKQFHENDKTLIDLNRAGTPLLEIVTEADFATGEEAAAYVEGLRLLVVHMGISDGKMAEGSYRCDVNISIRPVGQEAFGTKVEIKNLNSISNVQKSIEFEIKRQTEVLNEGGSIIQETRRFDEKLQETVSMRVKETLVDYRYFAEPNIPPIRLSNEFMDQPVIELPLTRQLRYVEDYKLSMYDAGVLVKNLELSEYFEAICEKSHNAKAVVNWLTQDLLAHSDLKGERSYSEWISVDAMASLLEEIEKGTISSKQAKEVFEHVVLGKMPKDIIEELGMVQVSDIAQIESWVQSVLDENPQAIIDYKNGMKKSVGFVVGQVMKLSKGQVNPKLASQTVVRLLDMN
ncbi:MAG: Asp-tRNA(Asn)/Glu-tRNA(Gln) amidotransferase subunit GatB [Erysipelothrix sp.]|nr:Asp-tRNA(Asn)/Glu-tRNA(Gln) amidotransferase subunit GatB [Erysipelothrix sp.]